jgi:hypothetical protein
MIHHPCPTNHHRRNINKSIRRPMNLPLSLMMLDLTSLRQVEMKSPSIPQAHLTEVDSTRKGYADTAINVRESILNRITNATYSMTNPKEAVRTHLPGLVLDLSALAALVADLNLVTETQESVRMTSAVRNRCSEGGLVNHRLLVTQPSLSSSTESKSCQLLWPPWLNLVNPRVLPSTTSPITALS